MGDEKIKNLINSFMCIPGFGPRSARRAVVYLLTNKKKQNIIKLIDNLTIASKNIQKCLVCESLTTNNPCFICDDKSRDKKKLCIVPTVADMWALERSDSYNGVYHILGGMLSAVNGVTPEDLSIKKLINRANQEYFNEIIMALGATLDAQTTSRYLSSLLEEKENCKITTLSYGIPLGGELDYLDSGTISTAINDRR